MTKAFQLFVKSSQEKLGIPILDKLELFLKAAWQFPDISKNKGVNLWKMFSSNARDHLVTQARIRVKGAASEQMSLYILTRHFCFTVIAAIAEREGVDLTSEFGAFQAWCDVMDKIILLKHGHAATSPHLVQEFSRAVDGAIATQIAVYGSDEIVPKCHRMQHIPEQIKEIKFVFDAFMIEKLHLITKDVLSNLHNPADFEASLLAGICERQISSLNSSIFQGLIGQTVPLQGWLGTLAASKMNCFGMHISVDDVVFRPVVGIHLGAATASVAAAAAMRADLAAAPQLQQLDGLAPARLRRRV